MRRRSLIVVLSLIAVWGMCGSVYALGLDGPSHSGESLSAFPPSGNALFPAQPATQLIVIHGQPDPLERAGHLRGRQQAADLRLVPRCASVSSQHAFKMPITPSFSEFIGISAYPPSKTEVSPVVSGMLLYNEALQGIDTDRVEIIPFSELVNGDYDDTITFSNALAEFQQSPVSLSSEATVPEPSSCGLLLLGCASLIGGRWLRKRSQ